MHDQHDAAALLHLYVNDHRAGSTAGVALAKRIRDENAGNATGEALARIVTEIEEDAAFLDRLAAGFGVVRNPVKQLGAFVGERLSRLKMNGRLRSYSPLSRVLELEALMAGVDAKRNLWRSLQVTSTGADMDVRMLIERATDQRRRLTELHARAAHDAFEIKTVAA